mmetsp:Transcript_25834/g.54608  ORF Transcript_25834/g.54608 Transcript_25834/m.54608 type:complete len:97 (+) Transcript_25834:833-1123(+)
MGGSRGSVLDKMNREELSEMVQSNMQNWHRNPKQFRCQLMYEHVVRCCAKADLWELCTLSKQNVHTHSFLSYYDQRRGHYILLHEIIELIGILSSS